MKSALYLAFDVDIGESPSSRIFKEVAGFACKEADVVTAAFYQLSTAFVSTDELQALP